MYFRAYHICMALKDYVHYNTMKDVKIWLYSCNQLSYELTCYTLCVSHTSEKRNAVGYITLIFITYMNMSNYHYMNMHVYLQF